MAKRKIVWSHRAKIKRLEILEYYTERNKSTTYSRKLNNKINREVRRLSDYPYIGIKTDIEGIRGLIIEVFIIFYEVSKDMIIIHTIWDSRQNPDDLKII